MRLSKLHLLAYGPFTRQTLDFGNEASGLTLVHGANEAGKSSTLKAMADLRFGFEHRSDAGFLHSKPLIGGEFVDANGQPVSLVRRKGRGKTLNLADFTGDDPDMKQSASASIEQQLCAGLDRNSFHALFGVDRDRMVKGGQDLFDTEGDVGTALFEASSGGRSVHEVLKHLNDSARRFYIPRARERGGHINQALRQYREHKKELQEARTLPLDWRRVERAHDTAADKLATLETRYKSLQTDRLRLTELRTVWPLLNDLDRQREELAKLDDVPVLADTAGEERRTASAGLAEIRASWQRSVDEVELYTRTLAGIPEHDPLLDMSESINRAVAAADSLAQKRLDMTTADQALQAARQKASTVASSIDPAIPLPELVARVPSRSERVRIDDLLHTHDQLTRDLRSLAHEKLQEHQTEDNTSLPLAPHEMIVNLRAARADVERNVSDLQRLDKLPVTLRSCKRDLDRRLAELGLPDASVLNAVRPLLDARVDEFHNVFEDNRRRMDVLTKESRAIEDKFLAQTRRQQELLGQGHIATRDDVQHARQERDGQWIALRESLIESTADVLPGQGERRNLADAYVTSVQQADQVVDTLALDTERAAELQQCGYLVNSLQRELNDNRQGVETLQARIEQQQRQWADQLQSAGAPALTPAELRDWQRQLQEALRTNEHIQQIEDELVTLQGRKEHFAASLRTNIIATALSKPSTESSLEGLIATTDEILETVARHQTRQSELAGERKERESQATRRAEREKELRDSLRGQASQVAAVHEALLLAQDSNAAVAKARLHEFDELATSQSALDDAIRHQNTTKNALDTVLGTIEEIRVKLGDEPGIEPRMYCDGLARRLRQAMERDKDRLLLKQKLEDAEAAQKTHTMNTERLNAQLQVLCRSAGSQSVDALPAIEARSLRKVELQQSLDRLNSQLANASPRSEAELRQRLADKDAVQLEVDETEAATAVDALEAQLREARAAEEATRLDLAAIDGSDNAARATEAMEQATANMANHLPAWLQSRLAHGLLQEALLRFRERAQAPMLNAASGYFHTMTDGRYTKLMCDDSEVAPVLMVQRDNADPIDVLSLSEGTRDQLYLALRLAAIDVRRGDSRNSKTELPLVLDDVLMSSDERRAALALRALSEFSTNNRVILFTHHRHITDLAEQYVSTERLRQVRLNPQDP